MRLLLDTHAFIWMLEAPEKLSARVVQAHNDASHTLLVSVVSLWEIQIKRALGKLDMEVPLAQIVREQIDTRRYALLDIRAEHVLALDALPRHHGDPFDRLLVAQAQTERVPLVSTDNVFARYPVELFW
ncbi:type II toxin-antitoxin system VapC family toxin [Metallibacterium sp.]|uniref:type II toxin-antitoxin system VapC family toxin n=1 Tax=Metallibacterium sp. TaxID=2940281 RepID=UPI00260B28E3|nr:type II toxin-antitoxin system VapC family toxin [Metallibacterium sp.]